MRRRNVEAKIKNNLIKHKRLLSAILAAVLGVTAFLPFVSEAEIVKAEEIVLKNPCIVPDGSMNAGQRVTWDCVWFGSYPQAEVIPSGMEYTSLDESLRRDGDVIVSDSVYAALQDASGWDDNNDITLNGAKYRRIRKGGATYATTGDSTQYQWSNGTDWHYFKYESIKWRVLHTDGKEALLMSDTVLDNQKYHIENESVTWETSTMRSWLNGYNERSNKQFMDYSQKNFISNAFNASEQVAITNSMLENADSDSVGGNIEGGNNTIDKIFLLSESDVCHTKNAESYGFIKDSVTEDEARYCHSSTYAKAMGMFSYVRTHGGGWWWLRTPGNSENNVQCVFYYGWLWYSGGYYVQYRYDGGVRPALNLNLSYSNLYTYAGTVCSDGTDAEVGAGAVKPGGEIPGGDATTKVKEALYRKNIKEALPDLNNLGTAELTGPKISLNHSGKKARADVTFPLFKEKMKVSLPIFDSFEIKAAEDNTVEVLIGIKKSEISNKEDLENQNNYWRDTYQQVKSLVKACGKKVDTTKLWNQFSRVRGKLRKLDANALFKVKGNVAGYMKLRMGEDGKIQGLVEGGFVAGLEASASRKIPVWWIVYSEFGIKGSVGGNVKLIFEQKSDEKAKGMQLEGGLEMKVSPTIALGADAVIADVKGGIEGTLGGEIDFPWKSFNKSVNVYLSGKAFIKVDTIIPKLKGEWSYQWPNLELYPDFGAVKKSRAVNLEYDPGVIAEEKVANISPEFFSRSVEERETASCYENAKPQITLLPDGRYLIVYLDDTLEGADGQTALMFRIHENGFWSDAKAVCYKGNLDMAGKLYSTSEGTWVIYGSSSRRITESDAPEEIAREMGLYVSKFNGESFEEPVSLGEAGQMKYNYGLAEDSFGDLYAIWTQNSENDILLENGRSQIYKAYLDESDGNWNTECVVDTDITVKEAGVGELGDYFSLAYVGDEKIIVDNGEYDEELDIGQFGESADSIRFYGGNLYFRADGILCRYDGYSVTSTGIKCTASYKIIDGVVYWLEQDNFNSELYSAVLEEKPHPVALTNEKEYIGGFDIAADASGERALAYTCQFVNETKENPYSTTILKFEKNPERQRMEITNVAYDIMTFVPGKKNDIFLEAQNTGTAALHNVTVCIRDSDGNILHSQALAEELLSGENIEKTLMVPIGEDFGTGIIIVELSAAEELDEAAKKEFKLEFSSADIRVEKKSVDAVTVVNDSKDAADNVVLAIRDTDETGSQIRTVEIGRMDAYSSKEVSILAQDWEKAAYVQSTNASYLYCEVEQGTLEYILWNNSIQLEKIKQDPSDKKPVKKPTVVKKQDSHKKQDDVSKKTLPINAIFTDTKSKAVYKVSTKKGEAVYLKLKKNVLSALVPGTVRANGSIYNVTSIEPNAFKNCRKLKKVKIGENIVSIGAKAFFGCKSLKKITIKSAKLKKVGKKAFKGIHAKAVIKVPKAKLKAYKKLLKKKGQGKKVRILK